MVLWVYNTLFSILNRKNTATISASQCEILLPDLNTKENKLHFQYHWNNYIFKVTINLHKLSTLLLGGEKFKSLMYYFCHFEKNVPTDTESYETIFMIEIHCIQVSDWIFSRQNNSSDDNTTNSYNYSFHSTLLFVKDLYIQCLV